MPVQWIDVTIPLREGMTLWPGDPPFRLGPLTRIAEGAGCNVSILTLGTHAGTHVDAPWHFKDDGKRLHEVDTAVFFGDAMLIDLPDVDHVRAVDLPEDRLPPRVLFKTRNSHYPPTGPFKTDYAAIEPDAAQRLVDDGVRLVGVDYLSVAPYHQEGQSTHHILLNNDVVIVEGLLLKDIASGVYPFVVLPLPVEGADGAPCRAFIGREIPS